MSSEHIFDLSCGAGHVVPDATLEALLQTGSGDAARLFLYLLMEKGRYAAQDAEAALHMSPAAQREALNLLQKAGLFRELVTPLPTAVDRDGRPEYASGAVARALQDAPGFRQVVDDVQRRLGRILSSSDLGILFGLYDWRGMTPGLISLLVSYCIDEMARKSPEGRPPTLRQIDRRAALWQELGLDTEEKAEVYICAQEKGRTLTASYARALGLHGRRPSATEQKLMDQWAAWGFPPESVALAYDKTALRLGTLNWNYMNTILTRWHEKGLHEPDAIVRGDAPPERTARTELSGARTPVVSRRTRGGAEQLEQYLNEQCR